MCVCVCVSLCGVRAYACRCACMRVLLCICVCVCARARACVSTKVGLKIQIKKIGSQNTSRKISMYEHSYSHSSNMNTCLSTFVCLPLCVCVLCVRARVCEGGGGVRACAHVTFFLSFSTLNQCNQGTPIKTYKPKNNKQVVTPRYL